MAMPQSRSVVPIDADGLAGLGRGTRQALAQIGAVAVLAGDAVRSWAFPRGAAPPFGPAVRRQMAWILAAGLPIVGLVHVGIGSFLSMQAFFGATFVDGAGAVVGIGLVRNVAPLLTGFIVAGMLAVRTTTELRSGDARDLDSAEGWVRDRDVADGDRPDDRPLPEPARLALPRIAGPMLAAPVLSLFGAAVGLLVGWQAASSVLGVPTGVYFGKFGEMVWQRDVLGLVVKPMVFAGAAALFACREGLREGPAGFDPRASFRVLAWSLPIILVLNLVWFYVAFIIGPPFGPTLMTPPS